MSNQDDELRRVLRLWETPQPSAQLDARIWSARVRPKPPRNWKWMSLAAGLVLAAGIAGFWPQGSPRLITRIDATGFKPVPDGAITVVSTGEKK